MSFEKTKEYWSHIKANFKKHLACDERALRRGAIFAFFAYVVVLFWALWLKFNDFHMVVLNYQWLSKLTLKERFLYDIVPFQIRFDFVNQFVQFPANAIVFAPLGVFLPYVFKKKSIWCDVAVCFGVSLAIELVQLFTLIGNFATADLIMNTVGYFIGFAFYKLVCSKFSLCATVWSCRAVNVVLLIALIVVVLTTINNWSLIVAILTRTL